MPNTKANNLHTLILGNRAICRTVIIKQIPCQEERESHLLSNQDERCKQDLNNFTFDFRKHTQPVYNMKHQTYRFKETQKVNVCNNMTCIKRRLILSKVVHTA
jgi:hypothetical protein